MKMRSKKNYEDDGKPEGDDAEHPEPDTNKFESERGSVFSERCVGDQHYVCLVGENIFDDDDHDSGYIPTTPPKSDQGSDREQAPKRPRDVAQEKVAPGPGDPNDPDDLEMATENEPNLVAKGLRKSNAQAYQEHLGVPIRRRVLNVQSASQKNEYTNWLAFEQHCQCRIALNHLF